MFEGSGPEASTPGGLRRHCDIFTAITSLRAVSRHLNNLRWRVSVHPALTGINRLLSGDPVLDPLLRVSDDMKRVEFELGLALIHLSVHSERIKGLRENRRERFPHSTADAWKEKNPTLPFRSFDRRWAMENGLVNGTLAKLVLLVVSLLRVKIEQSLSDCMANGTNDGWEIGNHEIAVEVLVLLLMDADKWQDLLAFLLTLRSESIEERIWRHLGAEDVWKLLDPTYDGSAQSSANTP